MIKKLFFWTSSYLLIFVLDTFSQNSFQASGDCQRTKNVNCADVQTSYLNRDNIRATLKFKCFSKVEDGLTYYGNCTGTLVNQFYDAGGVLRQLFITADHCFNEESLKRDFIFYFNYQSPICDDGGVPNIINSNRQGERYTFTSRVNKVANNLWTDGAIFEILTPIPPHFNPYYAGWDVTYNPFGIGLPKYVIHHPKGDIKKIAYTFTSLDILTNPVCHTVTVVVDVVLNFLFGWITEIRTETICTYLENPRIFIPFFTSGAMEEGSSGSSLFTTSNRTTGVLSGGFTGCAGEFGVNFGRLHSFWNASGSVRQALDRRQKTYLERAFGFVTGMDGQQPSCYSENPLPLNGNYFPANEYQPENKITINAANRALLASNAGHNNGNLRAFSGSDFVINAPDIEIGDGDFDVDAGATFELNNQVCSPANARTESQQDPLSGCQLARMEFDPEFQATEVDDIANYSVAISPNPASKEIKIEFNIIQNETIKIEILNTTGAIIKKIELEIQDTGLQIVPINTSDLFSGSYFCKFSTENYSQTLKFIILK